MKLFLHASLVLTLVLSLSGCASLIHDSEQGLRLTTYDESGSKIKGASCKLSNDFRSNTFDNQELVKVHRSYRDLQIECKKNGYTDATARVVSSVNAGIYGNVVTAGIGAIFDHALGSAYSYPQQLDLVFGKELTLSKHSAALSVPKAASAATPTLVPSVPQQATSNAAKTKPGTADAPTSLTSSTAIAASIPVPVSLASERSTIKNAEIIFFNIYFKFNLINSTIDVNPEYWEPHILKIRLINSCLISKFIFKISVQFS